MLVAIVPTLHAVLLPRVVAGTWCSAPCYVPGNPMDKQVLDWGTQGSGGE